MERKNLYRTGELSRVFHRFGESSKTVQHRIINIALQGVVSPKVIHGKGFGSTRYFTKEQVVELVIAFELSRMGMLMRSIKGIMEQLREKDIITNSISCYCIYEENDFCVYTKQELKEKGGDPPFMIKLSIPLIRKGVYKNLL